MACFLNCFRTRDDLSTNNLVSHSSLKSKNWNCKHLVDQLSKEAQDSLNSKFEEATAVDKKERTEHIQSGLEELFKNLNECCKQYGVRGKPTSLVELPFGWQPGIQEGAADWDEDWDKLEEEGILAV